MMDPSVISNIYYRDPRETEKLHSHTQGYNQYEWRLHWLCESNQWRLHWLCESNQWRLHSLCESNQWRLHWLCESNQKHCPHSGHNKIKSKKYHTVERFTKFNRNFVERGNIDFICFYYFSVEFWNRFDSVVIFKFSLYSFTFQFI